MMSALPTFLSTVLNKVLSPSKSIAKYRATVPTEDNNTMAEEEMAKVAYVNHEDIIDPRVVNSISQTPNANETFDPVEIGLEERELEAEVKATAGSSTIDNQALQSDLRMKGKIKATTPQASHIRRSNRKMPESTTIARGKRKQTPDNLNLTVSLSGTAPTKTGGCAPSVCKRANIQCRQGLTPIKRRREANRKATAEQRCRWLKRKFPQIPEEQLYEQAFKCNYDCERTSKVILDILKESGEGRPTDRTTIQEEVTEKLATSIECVCCFGDVDFENMAQCTEGHLTCVECLTAYAAETAHGTGKARLFCMDFNCEALYPESEMQRCVSKEVLEKLNERIQEEAINMAHLDDLVRCPQCHLAAQVSPTVKEFICFRDECGKKSCRYCGKLWTHACDHRFCGQTKGDPTKGDSNTDCIDNIRKKCEEEMTKIRVRVCPECRLPMIKDSGCNKMTCRCGMTLCYLCRTPNIGYSHYCQHLRSPGEQCDKCTKKCLLFTDAEAIDQTEMEKIEEEAKQLTNTSNRNYLTESHCL